MGIAWPAPRFTDNEDGTVTDNLTGLIWLKDATCLGEEDWDEALAAVNALNDGECGLSDGSVEGDWRLPNVRELLSLIDYSHYNPALPSTYDTYFDNVQSACYWSSTTRANITGDAWCVGIGGGDVQVAHDKGDGSEYLWPVRGESDPVPTLSSAARRSRPGR